MTRKVTRSLNSYDLPKRATKTSSGCQKTIYIPYAVAVELRRHPEINCSSVATEAFLEALSMKMKYKLGVRIIIASDLAEACDHINRGQLSAESVVQITQDPNISNHWIVVYRWPIDA